MCNVADVMHSTADSSRSATNGMRVTADIKGNNTLFQ